MTTAYDVAGDLRQCITCRAELRSPLPVDWTIELVKEGPPEGPVHTYLIPHRPGCAAPPADPQPGIAVRVPGAFIIETELAFGSFRSGHRCDCGQAFDTTAALLAHRSAALAVLAGKADPITTTTALATSAARIEETS